ncbi:hypothetical protein AeRB84_001268 [Aphanomyces euteiches]|nr:hypothetical protein AeRB84_001268 [Aphanomyces euteiches]
MNSSKIRPIPQSLMVRPTLHMCLVCGDGPFCGDHIGLHFDLCFEAHCPVSSNAAASTRPLRMKFPSRCHHPHGFKLDNEESNPAATVAAAWDEEHDCAYVNEPSLHYLTPAMNAIGIF